MLPSRPPGEDFFLAVVVIDTPEDPCWNDGFDIFGTWEQVDQTFSAYMAGRSDHRNVSVSLYQGDVARVKLLEGFKEEARHQAQMRARPNN